MVFLPFMALLFAVLDYSMVVFLQTTFKHAVRVGVRFAITNRLLAGYACHEDAVRSVVQTNTFGFLQGAAGLAKISVLYYDPTAFGGGGAPDASNTRNQANNVVEVTISPCLAVNQSDCFTWGWMAPLQSGWNSSGAFKGRTTSPLAIAARSSDRMEPPPGGSLPPVCP
jgi:hypothetical protein